MTALLAASALLALAAAPADDPCAGALAAAEAEAPRLAPELFVRGGFVDLGEAAAVSTATPTWRLSAGLELRLGKLRRARAIRDRALADCRGERLEAAVRAAVEAGEGVARAAALRARAEVLERRLPEAEGIAAAVARAVADERATVDELDAVRVRLDHLRALAADTAAAEAFAAGEDSPEGSLPALLTAWRAADQERARAALAVHRAGELDLALRGGWDQVLDGRRSVPLFGMATLTWDLGALARRRSERRVEEAGARPGSGAADLDRRATLLAARLRSLRATERTRLGQVAALRADLGAQLRVTDAVASAEVRRYRNTLWFELVRLEAERAYLEAHAAALDRLLGP